MTHKSAKLKTKGGAPRLVPFWQIEYWIKKRIWHELGYSFVTEAGMKEYDEWIEEKAKATAIAEAKKDSGPKMADGGIADAHLNVGGRSTAEPILPDAPEKSSPEPVITEDGEVALVEDDVEVKEVI